MKFHQATAIISKAEALALIEFASTDETRLHLTCVAFDWPEGSAVATDGHRLIKANSQAKHEAPMTLVPREALAKAAKACKRKTYAIHVSPGELRVLDCGPHKPEGLIGPDEQAITDPCMASFTEAIIPFHSPDVAFPPYQQVIPSGVDTKDAKRRASGRFGANADYLGALALVSAAAFPGSTMRGVTLLPGESPLDPILVTVGDAWTAVVMPMRI